MMYNRITAFLRRIDRQYTLSTRERLNKAASAILPQLTCVDIGASYYPHPPWELFRTSKSTRWVAVEPNVQNTQYIDTWRWPSQVYLEGSGLSQHGGEQTLYVTNVDSGSSLLPPVITDNMKHRVHNRSYFFPVTTRTIETKTLLDVVQSVQPETPVTLLKLDTQGSELSILKGAQALFDANRIVGIETEATMLAEPVMNGSSKFWEMHQYLEENGFELLHLTPIEAQPVRPRVKLRGRNYLTECDAVFAIKRQVALKASPAHALALFGFYLCYDLYEEAATLFDAIPDIDAICKQASVSATFIRRTLAT